MSKGMKLSELSDDDFFRAIDERRRTRMGRVDKMAPELRALVHDYGLNIVDSFVAIGVTKPKHIKHLVEVVLDEFSPTRGPKSAQGGACVGGTKRRRTENEDV